MTWEKKGKTEYRIASREDIIGARVVEYNIDEVLLIDVYSDRHFVVCLNGQDNPILEWRFAL